MRRRLFTVVVFAVLAGACVTTTASAPESDHAGGGEPGRTTVWARSCARCHPMRSPSSYSDAQWEVALFHHAVRTWISMPQMKTILELMKAAN